MKMPTHKIDAIKVIRDLPVVVTTQTVETVHYGTKTYTVAKVDIGLKEAKDLVEAIMVIQPPNYESESQKAKIESLQKENNKLREQLSDAENRLIHLRNDISTAMDKSYPSMSISEHFDYDNEPKF